MPRLRFHIGTIVILILLLAVGFAALRQSNEIWDSSMFSLTLGALLISILLAVHGTELRRAFWLGFGLFGSAYLGLSLVPSFESRLIATKALTFLGSKVPRAIPAGVVSFDYDNDGSMDLYVVNNSQPPALFRNKGDGTFQDVTAVAGLRPAGKQASLENIFAGTSLMGPTGTSENFVRIGHSLLALVAALLGGQLSRSLHSRNRGRTSGLSSPETAIGAQDG